MTEQPKENLYRITYRAFDKQDNCINEISISRDRAKSAVPDVLSAQDFDF